MTQPTAFDRLRDKLTNTTGHQPRQTGTTWMFRCPGPNHHHGDRNPSLSVTPITGAVLLHCHAGDTLDDILTAIGATRADLYDDPKGATYRYDDGRIVHRTPTKQFRQSGNTTSTPQLYHLARLLNATDGSIFLVEGEKDVHAIEAVGGIATTAPMGATNINKCDLTPLTGRHITAIVDNDPAGHTWATTVNTLITPLAARLRFQQAKTGKDAADHIAAGHNLNEFTPYTPPTTPNTTNGTHPTPPPEDPHHTFWTTRPALTHIHQFARARRVSPWATLGAVLARITAATTPDVQLPPTIGSHASLNLFIGLVGPPGAGKDAAAKVAADAIETPHDAFLTAPLGSGEGLSHMFMKETKTGPEQYNTAALVTIGEIDTLTALHRRQASTVTSQLRQAAMGEQLGFFYVDTAKRMIVKEHTYRLCLIVGIQPGRGGALLDDADGGTPQRFVWLPATDPDAPDQAPPEPTPMTWIKPWPWYETPEQEEQQIKTGRIVMNVCEQATTTIIAAHLARTRGAGDALDGHALLTRLKVAGSLALLDGRPSINDEDWHLAGTIMEISDHTRATIVTTLTEANRARNTAQAIAEAERAIVVEEKTTQAATIRVARGIMRKLANAGPTGLWRLELTRAMASRDRQWMDIALDHLKGGGQVEEQTGEYRGQTTTRYRIAERG